jgi:predicted metal-dependent peptidase
MSLTAKPIQQIPTSPGQLSLNAETKLSFARLIAVRQFPYFTAAIMSLAPREVPAGSLKTVAVTEHHALLWDRVYLDTLLPVELAADLVHEIMHILRNHARRCRALGADQKLFNAASDMEINCGLVEAKIQFKPPFVHPKDINAPDGLLAEEYYALLQQQQAQGKPAPGNSDPDAANGRCGSGGGWSVPGEPDLTDPANRSESEIAAVQRATAEEIKNHVAKHGQGSVPAGWVQWADVTLQPPRIPWEVKLARAVRRAIATRAGVVDRTYRKRSRIQGGLGFGAGSPVLAGTFAPIPRVGFAIDTSGSMGTKELTRAVSEGAAILKTVGAQVDFVSCDARVHANIAVRTPEEILKHCKGGGGTDFRPVFDAFERKRPPPEVLIFITDGCGPAPALPPRGVRDTIFVLCGPYRQKPLMYGTLMDGSEVSGAEMTWGTFIEIDDDKRQDDGAEV